MSFEGSRRVSSLVRGHRTRCLPLDVDLLVASLVSCYHEISVLNSKVSVCSQSISRKATTIGRIAGRYARFRDDRHEALSRTPRLSILNGTVQNKAWLIGMSQR